MQHVDDAGRRRKPARHRSAAELQTEPRRGIRSVLAGCDRNEHQVGSGGNDKRAGTEEDPIQGSGDGKLGYVHASEVEEADLQEAERSGEHSDHESGTERATVGTAAMHGNVSNELRKGLKG